MRDKSMENYLVKHQFIMTNIINFGKPQIKSSVYSILQTLQGGGVKGLSNHPESGDRDNSKVREDGADEESDSSRAKRSSRNDDCAVYFPRDKRYEFRECEGVNSTLLSHTLKNCVDLPWAYYNTHPQDSRIVKSEGIANSITARYGTGGGNVPLVSQKVYPNENSDVQFYTGSGICTMVKADVACCVKASGGPFSANMYDLVQISEKGEKISEGMAHEVVVRKTTPVECERLQGFPDNWTRIPYRGRSAEECPHGLRYKAIGNSMAVPVMKFIGERIQFLDDCLRGVVK